MRSSQVLARPSNGQNGSVGSVPIWRGIGVASVATRRNRLRRSYIMLSAVLLGGHYATRAVATWPWWNMDAGLRCADETGAVYCIHTPLS